MTSTKMEDQRPSSPVPTIASPVLQKGVPQTPVSTADMTIEELMAHFKRLNRKFKICK